MKLEDDILIENFLRNNLSENESVDFLARVSNDLDFKEKYLFEKELFETYNEEKWNAKEANPKLVKEYKELFKNSEAHELKETILKVQNEFQKPKSKVTFSKKLFYLSAAMIALLFTIYVVTPKSISNQDLYTSYIQKENLPSLITRSKSQNDLKIAQDFFEKKKYKEALSIFEKELEKSNIEDANIYIYTGISQMELNKLEDAEKTFDRLISSGLIDSSKGKWYKSLLYIKKDNIQEAKSILKEIKQKKSYNHMLAEELLKRISD
jgi:hypothetical protein